MTKLEQNLQIIEMKMEHLVNKYSFISKIESLSTIRFTVNAYVLFCLKCKFSFQCLNGLSMKNAFI